MIKINYQISWILFSKVCIFFNKFHLFLMKIEFYFVIGSNRFLLDTKATLFIPSIKLLCSVGKTSDYASSKIANKVNLFNK